MKRIPPMDEGNRFRAQVRHYHRSGTRREASWREWVDGDQQPRRWLMKVGVATAFVLVVCVALAGILHFGVR